MDFEFVKRQPVLEDPPLKLVICQMRFSRLIGFSESDVRPIQQAVASTYPLAEVGRSANLVLGPAGISQTSEPEPLFQFRSDDGAWTLTITPESTSLETTAYHDFLDFLGRWVECAEIVLKTLDVTRQNRVGLRYVNELTCPPRPDAKALLQILREDAIGIVGRHPRASSLLQSMHEMRFAQDRGVCTVRHGLMPQTDDQSSYILDFDFYDDNPRVVDLDGQQRLLADFNHGAFELFRWIIQEDYFATFKPQEVPDA